MKWLDICVKEWFCPKMKILKFQQKKMMRKFLKNYMIY